MSITEVNSNSLNGKVNLTQARSLYIHTGNMVNSNGFKRIGVSQSATSELSQCINGTIQTWLESLNDDDKFQLQDMTSVVCSNKRFLEPLPAEERDEYRITVKIFIGVQDKEAIRDAINSVLSDLSVTSVETVILSVPDDERKVQDVVDVWRILEQEVDAGRVYSLGISDLNKEQLEELYETVKVKPVINQVNLTTCCVISQDLSDYAKDHDVQLLTHNDPPVILSEEDYQKTIDTVLTQSHGQLWRPYWVARYSVLIKSRGVIKTKGFIIASNRDQS